MTNEAKPASAATEKKAPLEEQVTQDVGGVQGSPEAEGDGGETQAGVAAPGAPSDQPAPDAGEIEWAGQLVKKPSHPEN